MQLVTNYRGNEKVIRWLETVSLNVPSAKKRFCFPFRYLKRRSQKTTPIGYAQTVGSALERVTHGGSTQRMISEQRLSKTLSRQLKIKDCDTEQRKRRKPTPMSSKLKQTVNDAESFEVVDNYCGRVTWEDVWKQSNLSACMNTAKNPSTHSQCELKSTYQPGNGMAQATEVVSGTKGTKLADFPKFSYSLEIQEGVNGKP